MEYDPFKLSRHELAGENSDDDDEDVKKKAKRLGHLAAPESDKKETKSSEKTSEEKTAWQKYIAEMLAPKREKAEDAEGTDKPEAKRVEAVELDKDAETVSEEEAPLEGASPAEAITIADDFSQERSETLGDIPTEDDETAAVRDGALRLHENLQRLFRQPDVAERPLEDMINQATEQTIDELENPTSEFEPHIEPSPTAEAPRDLPDDEPVWVATPGVGSTGGTGGGRRARGTGGGSAPPPRTPVRTGFGSAAVPPPRSALGGASRLAANQPAGGETISQEDSRYYERRALQRGLLVGGIVGYLIGRRRGRIKTERRLGVVQQKLEKQVADIQQNIADKELQIQQLTRQRFRQKLPLPARVETARPRNAELPAAAERTPRSDVRPIAERPLAAAERSTIERPARANQAPARPEQRTAEPAETRSLEQFDRAELLSLAQNIRFGETNLRRVYESRLVNEAGLRRLIGEYYAGHDLRRALAREFLAKEMRFERDPRLRDTLPPDLAAAATGQTDTAQSSQGGTQAGNATASTTGLAAPQAKKIKMPKLSQQKPANTSALVTMLFVIIVLLAAYAIWLTIRR